MRAFHATDSVLAQKILDEGFGLDVPRRSDPGDLGLAVYFTTNIHRARACGNAILEARLQPRNPLRLSEHGAYALVLDQLGFDTIHGYGSPEGRIEAARKAREWFLSHGYDALVSVRGPRDLEIAVYDLGVIGKPVLYSRR